MEKKLSSIIILETNNKEQENMERWIKDNIHLHPKFVDTPQQAIEEIAGFQKNNGEMLIYSRKHIPEIQAYIKRMGCPYAHHFSGNFEASLQIGKDEYPV